jgi:hypothetical protein
MKRKSTRECALSTPHASKHWDFIIFTFFYKNNFSEKKMLRAFRNNQNLSKICCACQRQYSDNHAQVVIAGEEEIIIIFVLISNFCYYLQALELSPIQLLII